MRVLRHKWCVPLKPFKYDDDDFTFDTDVCYCNECDTLRHEGLGGHECYKICNDCNINNTTCTQVGSTTCFVCHAPLETYAYVLRFCTEALEQYVRAVLAFRADDLCNRLRECITDLIDILEEILEPGELYTMKYLTDSFTARIISNEDIEKEIEHYMGLCTHHTSTICIYPTEKIAEMRALLEEFNRWKAAVFARAADAPVDDASSK
jgi:hypothetical protein